MLQNAIPYLLIADSRSCRTHRVVSSDRQTDTLAGVSQSIHLGNDLGLAVTSWNGIEVFCKIVCV